MERLFCFFLFAAVNSIYAERELIVNFSTNKNSFIENTEIVSNEYNFKSGNINLEDVFHSNQNKENVAVINNIMIDSCPMEFNVVIKGNNDVMFSNRFVGCSDKTFSNERFSYSLNADQFHRELYKNMNFWVSERNDAQICFKVNISLDKKTELFLKFDEIGGNGNFVEITKNNDENAMKSISEQKFIDGTIRKTFTLGFFDEGLSKPKIKLKYKFVRKETHKVFINKIVFTTSKDYANLKFKELIKNVDYNTTIITRNNIPLVFYTPLFSLYKKINTKMFLRIKFNQKSENSDVKIFYIQSNSLSLLKEHLNIKNWNFVYGENISTNEISFYTSELRKRFVIFKIRIQNTKNTEFEQKSFKIEDFRLFSRDYYTNDVRTDKNKSVQFSMALYSHKKLPESLEIDFIDDDFNKTVILNPSEKYLFIPKHVKNDLEVKNYIFLIILLFLLVLSVSILLLYLKYGNKLNKYLITPYRLTKLEDNIKKKHFIKNNFKDNTFNTFQMITITIFIFLRLFLFIFIGKLFDNVTVIINNDNKNILKTFNRHFIKLVQFNAEKHKEIMTNMKNEIHFHSKYYLTQKTKTENLLKKLNTDFKEDSSDIIEEHKRQMEVIEKMFSISVTKINKEREKNFIEGRLNQINKLESNIKMIKEYTDKAKEILESVEELDFDTVHYYPIIATQMKKNFEPNPNLNKLSNLEIINAKFADFKKRYYQDVTENTKIARKKLKKYEKYDLKENSKNSLNDIVLSRANIIMKFEKILFYLSKFEFSSIILIGWRIYFGVDTNLITLKMIFGYKLDISYADFCRERSSLEKFQNFMNKIGTKLLKTHPIVYVSILSAINTVFLNKYLIKEILKHFNTIDVWEIINCVIGSPMQITMIAANQLILKNAQEINLYKLPLLEKRYNEHFLQQENSQKMFNEQERDRLNQFNQKFLINCRKICQEFIKTTDKRYHNNKNKCLIRKRLENNKKFVKNTIKIGSIDYFTTDRKSFNHLNDPNSPQNECVYYQKINCDESIVTKTYCNENTLQNAAMETPVLSDYSQLKSSLKCKRSDCNQMKYLCVTQNNINQCNIEVLCPVEYSNCKKIDCGTDLIKNCDVEITTTESECWDNRDKNTFKSFQNLFHCKKSICKKQINPKANADCFCKGRRDRNAKNGTNCAEWQIKQSVLLNTHKETLFLPKVNVTLLATFNQNEYRKAVTQFINFYGGALASYIKNWIFLSIAVLLLYKIYRTLTDLFFVLLAKNGAIRCEWIFNYPSN